MDRAQAHNSTYWPAIIITVMDLVREQHRQGVEVTNGTLFRAISASTGVPKDSHLRQRIEAATRYLDRAGHITRRLNPDNHPIPVKVITPVKP